MTVLIPAATGQVASRLARRLRDVGVPVRALARDRVKVLEMLAGPRGDLGGIEVAVGPLDNGAFLADALRGVEIAFLSVGTDPRQTALEKGFIDAARQAGLPHLVKLSTIDAGRQAPNPVGRWHAEIEDHLAASGVASTILRPAYFTTNLLRTAAPSVARTRRWAGTSPHGRIAMIDPRDVAETAAAIITNAALRGPTYELTGPDAVTLPEVAGMLSRLLGREITYVSTSQEEMRRAMADRGVPDYYAEVAMGIDRSVEAGLHERVTGEVEKLVGRPARTVADFLTDHAGVFSGVAA